MAKFIVIDGTPSEILEITQGLKKQGFSLGEAQAIQLLEAPKPSKKTKVKVDGKELECEVLSPSAN